ncbi:hypothetical protein [Agaribacterium sp. ZY112]|uniref:hypothetical protein n=1 Tax=Agaribacterium sp. ZY112 TaxID=3233574 RepID=UPI0035252AEE
MSKQMHFIYGAVLAVTGVSHGAWANQTTTSYTYNDAGQVTSVDGPRVDVNDVSTFEYNDNYLLTKATNALGHEVQIQEYDAYGNPSVVVDENGVTTRYGYHIRGWLESTHIESSPQTVSESRVYDGVGNLVQVTTATSGVFTLEYDAANRLTAVVNSLNERMEYSLDAAGNVLSVKVYAADGSLVMQELNKYDELSRLMEAQGNDGQSSSYKYDANDNLIESYDSFANLNTNNYDALNRIEQSIDRAGNPISLSYNSSDQITSVTDQRGNVTSYEYDYLGNLIKLSSPDTGVSDYVYDDASNLINQSDANGVQVSYSYDALNRLTGINYANAPSLNINYRYDDFEAGSNFGRGKLAEVNDGSGYTRYRYDALGQVTNRDYQINGNPFSISNTYSPAGLLESTRYPSGRLVRYEYDELGRVQALYTQAEGGSEQGIVAQIQYLPFGPVSSWTYGNGVVHSANYDLDYRLTALAASGSLNVLDLEYGYDTNNNITELDNNERIQTSQRFDYTVLDQVKSASGAYGDVDYIYDQVGNRLSRSITKDSTDTENYVYAADSNRLQKVNTEGGSRDLFYDANGNLIDDLSQQVMSWVYGVDNRPESVSIEGQEIHYRHNYLGQRVLKSQGSSVRYFHYNSQGQLIAVSDETGTFVEEYIYLNDQLVAYLTEAQEPVLPLLPASTSVVGGRSLVGDDVTLTLPLDTIPSPSSVQWSSSIDGFLGEGSPLIISNLSVGAHQIQAQVQDSNQQYQTVVLDIYIYAEDVLLQTSFDDASALDSWAIVDIGDNQGPSVWAVENEELVQSSNIFKWHDAEAGSYIYYEPGSEWTNYTASVSLRSSDNDGLGLSFRAQNKDNYYRFFMDHERTLRKLIRVQNGEKTILHSDTIKYVIDQDYDLKISAIGDQIEIKIDGERWYKGTDDALSQGTVSLFVWGAQNAYFDDLKVVNANIENTLPVMSIGDHSTNITLGETAHFAATASDAEDGDLSSRIRWASSVDGDLGNGTALQVADLSSGLHTITASIVDSRFGKAETELFIRVNAASNMSLLQEGFDMAESLESWSIVDLGVTGGPSVWTVEAGELVQNSNIHDLSNMENGSFIYYKTGLAWMDYRASVTLRSSDDDGLGLSFRLQDQHNYYRFVMDAQRSYRKLIKMVDGVVTTLHSDTVNYVIDQEYALEVSAIGNVIEVHLDGELWYSGVDDSLNHGTVAPYIWAEQKAYFDNLEVNTQGN